jgi:DNA-binding MurR/RpiR family transcriptional regulator
MNLLGLHGRIRNGFDAIAPLFREAARWVIDHPTEVALLSTREQARRAGVTPATMTRLAQRFGLSGYEGVRKLHADAVRQRPENYRGRAEELLVRREREGDAALVQDVFAALAEHLQALSAPEQVARFAAAADLVSQAEHVYCLGLRSSFAVAYMFHYVRSLFGANSVLVDGAGATGIDVLRSIGRADVLLAVSVNRYVRQTVDATHFARGRGTRIVAVTDSEMSPLARAADVSLIVHTETPSFFHTMTPAFAAVECLAALVAARRGRKALDALGTSERQLSDFGTYLLPRRKGRQHP